MQPAKARELIFRHLNQKLLRGYELIFDGALAALRLRNFCMFIGNGYIIIWRVPPTLVCSAAKPVGLICMPSPFLPKSNFCPVFWYFSGATHFPHRNRQVKNLQVSDIYCPTERFNCPANCAVLSVGKVSYANPTAPSIFVPGCSLYLIREQTNHPYNY